MLTFFIINQKGLKQMRAYEEQINLLERIKLKFCNNAFNQLRNVINHSVSELYLQLLHFIIRF